MHWTSNSSTIGMLPSDGWRFGFAFNKSFHKARQLILELMSAHRVYVEKMHPGLDHQDILTLITYKSFMRSLMYSRTKGAYRQGNSLAHAGLAIRQPRPCSITPDIVVNRPGEGSHSMKVTTYAPRPPFRPPFFGSLENLYSFDPYFWAKMRKMSYFDPPPPPPPPRQQKLSNSSPYTQ